MAPSGRVLSSPRPPSSSPKAILFETPRLTVRRPCKSYATDIAKAASHPQIVAGLRDGFPSPYTLADAESFIDLHAEPKGTNYPTYTAVFIKPSTEDNPGSEDLYIGTIGVEPKEGVYYRTWELGYWLTPSFWGKGYATEMVKGMLRFCFETWPSLNRMEAVAYARNEASIKVLRKAGYLDEGVKRGIVEKNGEMLDELLLAVTRSDYENSTSG